MRKKVTINSLNEMLSDVGDIIVSEKYNPYEKMKIQCNICKQIYEKKYAHISRGQRCVNCSIKNGKYKILQTEEDVKKYIQNSGNELLSNYINSATKMKIKCGKSGHIFYMDWNKYRLGRRCKECNKEHMSEKFRTEYNEIKRYIEDKGDTLISDKYINCNIPIEIKCGKCGGNFTKAFQAYKDSRGCRKCNPSSKGESIIIEYLNNIGLPYIPEAKFENCIYINSMRFDFYIPIFNLCIEFDGIQHYKPVDYFGGTRAFEETKKRDELKNKFCETNNINLLRISYLDIDNVGKILDKLFLNYIIDELIYSN